DLVHARRQDDRRGHEEREPGRVLVAQAAEQSRDHGDARPADAGEQGADLRHPDQARLLGVERVEATALLPAPAYGWAPAEPFAEEQDGAVDREEDRRRQRLREQRAQLVLEDEADDPGRNGGDDEHPGHALVRRLDTAGAQRPEEAADDADPVLAEEDQQ